MIRARLAGAAVALALLAPAGRPGPQPARLIPPLEVDAPAEHAELVRVSRGAARDLPTPPAPTTSSSTSTTRPRPANRPDNIPANIPPRSLRVRVTCYGPPQFPAGQHTATGRPVGPGSLAVDPRLIPLGSTVTLAGLGTYTANDTGGAIIGPHVDLWRPSCAGWPNPTVAASW